MKTELRDFIYAAPDCLGLRAGTLKRRHRNMRPVPMSVDPRVVGWGLIFGSSVSDELKDLIRYKLGRTRTDVTEFLDLPRPDNDESAENYLERHGQTAGAPIDGRTFPYYVLIVADPQEISFRFQIELGIQNGVGRLWLGDDLERYASYCDRVASCRLHQFDHGAEGPGLVGLTTVPGADTASDRARRLMNQLGNLIEVEVQSLGEVARVENSSALRVGLCVNCSHGAPPHKTSSCPAKGVRSMGELCGDETGSGNRYDLSVWPEKGYPKGFWSFSCFGAGQGKSLIDSGLGVAPDTVDAVSSLSLSVLDRSNFFISNLNAVSPAFFTKPDWSQYASHFEALVRGLQAGAPVGRMVEDVLAGHWVRNLLTVEEKRRVGDIEGTEDPLQVVSDLGSIVIHGDPAATAL